MVHTIAKVCGILTDLQLHFFNLYFHSVYFNTLKYIFKVVIQNKKKLPQTLTVVYNSLYKISEFRMFDYQTCTQTQTCKLAHPP